MDEDILRDTQSLIWNASRRSKFISSSDTLINSILSDSHLIDETSGEDLTQNLQLIIEGSQRYL